MKYFLSLREAYQRAAQAKANLNEAHFLEQARGHISAGALRASGIKMGDSSQLARLADGGLRMMTRIAGVILSKERVEIPPLAMADHILSFSGDDAVICSLDGTMSGWARIRLIADDVDRLWPVPILRQGATAGRKRGPKTDVRGRVTREMVVDLERGIDLGNEKQEVLEKKYGASRDTCMKALNRALSELKSRQIATIDK
jgi:hypothetical protein